MPLRTSWLLAAGKETIGLLLSRIVAYSGGNVALSKPNSNPSTPPSSTQLIHNFWIYLLSGSHEVLRLQKTGDGNILVDRRPVNADTAADELPFRPLLRRRGQQARKPGEPHAYRP